MLVPSIVHRRIVQSNVQMSIWLTCGEFEGEYMCVIVPILSDLPDVVSASRTMR
jgi:hypothetical protein